MIKQLACLRAGLAMGPLLLILGGCGDGGGGQGTLKVSVTDAPVDGATHVVIRFSGIEIKHENEAPQVVNFSSPRQIDLLEQQDGRAAVLIENQPLTAGRFEWLRLLVDADPNVGGDSYIDFANGERCELRIPSGMESGLKLNRGFTLPADGSAAVTVDFDLRRSIHAPPGQNALQEGCSNGQIYLMRPTLRLVDDAQVGAIAGTVDPQIVAEKCESDETGAVYIFSVPAGQTVATLDDVDGTDDPISSALVKLNAQSAYAYRAAFLPAGSYTVAFTCDADLDRPDIDTDPVTFVPEEGKTVTVQNNLITTVDFTAADLIPPP